MEKNTAIIDLDRYVKLNQLEEILKNNKGSNFVVEFVRNEFVDNNLRNVYKYHSVEKDVIVENLSKEITELKNEKEVLISRLSYSNHQKRSIRINLFNLKEKNIFEIIWWKLFDNTVIYFKDDE